MSDEEFASYRQGLITLLLEKPKNMNEKAGRFWRDIESERWSFDTTTAIATEVEKLSKEDILALFRSAILQQQKPWLLITQGGTVNDWPTLDDSDRSALPQF